MVEAAGSEREHFAPAVGVTPGDQNGACSDGAEGRTPRLEGMKAVTFPLATPALPGNPPLGDAQRITGGTAEEGDTPSEIGGPNSLEGDSNIVCCRTSPCFFPPALVCNTCTPFDEEDLCGYETRLLSIPCCTSSSFF